MVSNKITVVISYTEAKYHSFTGRENDNKCVLENRNNSFSSDALDMQ